MDSSWKLDKADKFQFSGPYQEQRNHLEQLGPKGLRAQGSIGIDSHSPNPYSTQLDLVSEQSPMIEYHAISQSYGIRDEVGEVDNEEADIEMVAEMSKCINGVTEDLQ